LTKISTTTITTTKTTFRNWIKEGRNIKLSTDSAILCLIHEGITDFNSLLDFDRDSIEALPRACSKSIDAVAVDVANSVISEPAVYRANINSLAVRRIFVAMRAIKYYD